VLGVLEFRAVTLSSGTRAVQIVLVAAYRKSIVEDSDDPERFPTLMLTDTAPISLGPESAFNEEIRLFMLGLEHELKGKAAEPEAGDKPSWTRRKLAPRKTR
jgi:hypothetical protein